MDNSIYVAMTRELSLFRDMDVTANNVANANTTGFGAEHILFHSYLTHDVNQGDRNPLAFATEASTYRNTENGTLRVTGNQLDVAIQGAGFLEVQTPLGMRYTRAGNLKIDATGDITTQEGYPVVDSSGQALVVPQGATTIKIGTAGNVTADGEDLGSFNIVEFDNPQLLERLDGRLFKTNATPNPAVNSVLAQGMLENSNVQPVTELTHMMKLSHTVADTAKFIEFAYDLERKAANTWAQQS